MTEKEQLQREISKRIKQIRENKQIPQQDLAALCNFEKSNMARLEAGKTNPTLEKIFKMEDLFNIPVSAWRDIKSYLQKNDTPKKGTTTTPQGEDNGE